MPNILIMTPQLRRRPGRYRELLGEAGFTPLDPPGTGKLSEADLRFALLLALTRNVLGNDRSIRAGGWDRKAVRPLRGTTLYIFPVDSTNPPSGNVRDSLHRILIHRQGQEKRRRMGMNRKGSVK
jgi:hypothetical protein